MLHFIVIVVDKDACINSRIGFGDCYTPTGVSIHKSGRKFQSASNA